MMIRLVKDGREVTVKDFLANLYIRNGYEIVVEKAEPKAEEVKASEPKKTIRRTKKTQ